MKSISFGQILAIRPLAAKPLELVLQKTPVADSNRPFAPASVRARPPQGIAVVNVDGYLQQNADIYSDLGFATSTQQVAADVQQAANNPNCSGIMMLVNSPGGDAMGLSEAFQTIRAAAATKPVCAFVEGLSCSAAYRLTAAATEICVAPDSITGSIGCFAIVVDASELADAQGFKVHVIRSAAGKGTGTFGSQITAENLAQIQRTVDALAGTFIDDLAAGREISRTQAQALADGYEHVGAAAVANGLADVVCGYDEAMNRLVAMTAGAAARSQTSTSSSQRAGSADDFRFIARERAKSMSRDQAVARVQRLRPDLYRAWVRAGCPAF